MSNPMQVHHSAAAAKHCPKIKHFHKVYACAPMYEFAQRLVESDPTRFETALCVGDSTFDDGNQTIKIPYPQCDGQNLVYVCSHFHNDERKLLDMRVMEVLSEHGARSLSVIVPFFGSATNERVETGVENGIPFETVAVAALDSKALGRLGNGNTRVRVLTYDLHTLAQRFYVPPSVHVIMDSTLPHVLKSVIGNTASIIVTPDAGALVRFREYFTHMRSMYFYKERVPGTDKRILRAADPEKLKGQNVLIVDDLTRSGNTIAECAQRCREYGAERVCAFVAHAVFPKGEGANFQEGGAHAGLLDKFYVTSSLPHVTARLTAPFEIVDFLDIVVNSSSL